MVDTSIMMHVLKVVAYQNIEQTKTSHFLVFSDTRARLLDRSPK